MWRLYHHEQALEVDRLKLLARLVAVELFGTKGEGEPQGYGEMINDRLPGMVMKPPRESVPVITEEMKKKWGVYENGEFIGLRAKKQGRATREDYEKAEHRSADDDADEDTQAGAPFMPPFENV